MSVAPRCVRGVAAAVLVSSISLVGVATTATAASATTEAELRTQFEDLTATTITLANDITLSDCGPTAGDLYIAGHPLLAAYTSYKGGHALNNKLLRKLLADESAWELVSFDNAKTAPAGFAELAPAW